MLIADRDVKNGIFIILGHFSLRFLWPYGALLWLNNPLLFSVVNGIMRNENKNILLLLEISKDDTLWMKEVEGL
jgi:hypothetical protein